MNSIPNARMYKKGTVTGGISTLDPYLHGYIGFQIAEPLYINLRQSAEISNLNEDAKRLYPGADIKVRLLEETRSRPALSVGLQSAFGHKRMAGEYIVASKRFRDFDFTAGLGWGRFGSAGHFNNPLKSLSSHFGKERALDSEISASPEEWFTGEKIGVFGGIEYFTPITGLSIKADYGADRYLAEQSAFGFEKPAPWSIGLNYSPYPWIDGALALQGGDKIMGRISLKNTLENWPFNTAGDADATSLRPYRSGLFEPNAMQIAARKDGALVYNVNDTAHNVHASLDLRDYKSTPAQLNIAATNLANHAGSSIENITIRPTKNGLKGPLIKLNRRDLEMALAHNKGSAEEIWANTEIMDSSEKTSAFVRHNFKRPQFRFILDNHFSLSEEDSGVLYRSSFITEVKGPRLFGLLQSATALRLNIADNLDNLKDLRPASLLPVRSNVYDFADNTFSIDRAYFTHTYSLNSSWHTALSAGYLEEMYGGAGGEILYRPFNARWALGGEAWLAFKRDPAAQFNAGFNGDTLLSGHINAYFDVPADNVVFKGSLGRYLAEDIGAELSLRKNFLNGAYMEGFFRVSDNQDFDVFGGTTHNYHGVRLSLPLGSIKHIPDGSTIHTTFAPFGRDAGQRLDKPIDLYKETEAFSKHHIARYWQDITPP